MPDLIDPPTESPRGNEMDVADTATPGGVDIQEALVNAAEIVRQIIKMNQYLAIEKMLQDLDLSDSALKATLKTLDALVATVDAYHQYVNGMASGQPTIDPRD